MASGSARSFEFELSAAGGCTIQFSVVDDDGGSASVQQTFVLEYVVLQNGTLLIGGTPGNDTAF